MSIFGLIAAFGGGVFASAIGGVESFVFTGVFAIVGAIASMAGLNVGGFLVSDVAFGAFFGPYVAFTGAVGAAAYAKKKGVLENGADIITCLSTLNEPDVLVVGGIVGMIGYLFKVLLADGLFGGTISPKLATDTPGFTVFWVAVVIRLVFGGKLFTGSSIVSKGKAFTNMLVMSVGFSIVVAFVYAGFVQANAGNTELIDAVTANYPVLVFGMAAVGLLFACGGQGFYGCHHIIIIAALGATKAYAKTGNIGMAAVVGVVTGTCAGILNDAETCVINSGTDSHIDGPGFAIFIMTFIISAIFN